MNMLASAVQRSLRGSCFLWPCVSCSFFLLFISFLHLGWAISASLFFFDILLHSWIACFRVCTASLFFRCCMFSLVANHMLYMLFANLVIMYLFFCNTSRGGHRTPAATMATVPWPQTAMALSCSLQENSSYRQHGACGEMSARQNERHESSIGAHEDMASAARIGNRTETKRALRKKETERPMAAPTMAHLHVPL